VEKNHGEPVGGYPDGVGLKDRLRKDPGAPASPSDSMASSGQPRPSRHLARRFLTWVLVVLFALLTPLTLTAAWAVKTLTNTDAYVSTMQPIVTDPVVQGYIAHRATNTLFDQINVEKKVKDALPKSAGFAAAPITAQLKQFTNKQILKIVSSTWFANLWERENRFTQSQALAILQGNPSPKSTKARELVVDLTPTLVQAIDSLNKKGVTFFNPLKTHLQNTHSLTLQLFSSKQVKQVQGFFRIAIAGRLVLMIVTPLVGLAAIALSLRRRRTAFRVMIAGIVGTLFLAVGLTVGEQIFVTSVPLDAQLFATHLVNIMIRNLRSTFYTAITFFALGAVVLWLFGDTQWAKAGRTALRSGAKQAGETVDQARKSEAARKLVAGVVRSGRSVGTSPVFYRWIGAIVAAIFIITTHTIAGVWWIIALEVLYQLGIIALERWVQSTDPQEMTQIEGPAPKEPSELKS